MIHARFDMLGETLPRNVIPCDRALTAEVEDLGEPMFLCAFRDKHLIDPPRFRPKGLEHGQNTVDK